MSTQNPHHDYCLCCGRLDRVDSDPGTTTTGWCVDCCNQCTDAETCEVVE